MGGTRQRRLAPSSVAHDGPNADADADAASQKTIMKRITNRVKYGVRMSDERMQQVSSGVGKSKVQNGGEEMCACNEGCGGCGDEMAVNGDDYDAKPMFARG